ncbi:MAG TPA: hypothetical protein ENH11_00905 [Candidatus Acetothermia bacterium]|nr:hypothetical protein [Candidatus Acetothermia bacterium]
MIDNLRNTVLKAAYAFDLMAFDFHHKDSYALNPCDDVFGPCHAAKFKDFRFNYDKEFFIAERSKERGNDPAHGDRMGMREFPKPV